MTTKVSDGKVLNVVQFHAASYVLRVISATALTPPSASMTDLVSDSVSIRHQFSPIFLELQQANNAALTPISLVDLTGAMIDWRKLTVKQRLAVLRYSQGDLTQDQFSAAIGELPGSTRYKEAERTGNLGRHLAEAIYRRFPELDAGWLYQGLTGNLTQAMEKRLSDAAREIGLGSARFAKQG